MSRAFLMGADLGGLGDGEGGFFDSILGTVSKVGDYVSKNSGQIVQVLDAVGRARGKTATQTNQISTAWNRNMTGTPYQPLERQSEMIPGVPNLAILGLVGLGLVLVLMKKKEA